MVTHTNSCKFVQTANAKNYKNHENHADWMSYLHG